MPTTQSSEKLSANPESKKSKIKWRRAVTKAGAFMKFKGHIKRRRSERLKGMRIRGSLAAVQASRKTR